MKIDVSSDGWHWLATDEDYDGPGSPLGTGSTAWDAIRDLIDKLEERDMRRKTADYHKGE